MKIEEILIQSLQKLVRYYIGQNKGDNFDVIDMGNPNDFWFHAKNISSCHIVVELPQCVLSKNDMRQIIKAGCLLCKKYTQKLKSSTNIEFIYARIKDISKTNIPGCVTSHNSKTIIC